MLSNVEVNHHVWIKKEYIELMLVFIVNFQRVYSKYYVFSESVQSK